eukprot:TRINITY_DN9204_c1_g1_i2.p1 TRINITY_DN9204_c1_g1~~TRINITY_DN9204_c1_g1_i2.p1  ORF type:complete len:445 (+),score=51.49 TRINITY_DN9204_c1_g1_i2:60-1337(+)
MVTIAKNTISTKLCQHRVYLGSSAYNYSGRVQRNNRVKLVVRAAAPRRSKKSEEPQDSKPSISLSDEEMRKRVESITAVINKEYGEGTATTWSKSAPEIQRISSGDPFLDYALGGGYPKGKIVEIYGPASAGKSTMCLVAVAEVQKNNGLAAYIDVENSFDPSYAMKFGVDPDKLILVDGPDCGETALQIIDKLTRNGCDLIIVDSVSALVPKSELQGSIEDFSVGSQARMMSKALRTICPSVNRANTVLIFINQLRNKIGSYGNPETTSGGTALGYYASQRLDVRANKADQVKDGDEVIGQRIKATVKKNKCGIPFRTAYVTLMYNKGIDKLSSLVDVCEQLKIIEKAGSWYSYNSTKLGQGREKAAEKVRNSPEIQLALLQALKEKSSTSFQQQKDDQQNGAGELDQDFSVQEEVEQLSDEEA